jgi:hypothetical protein
LMIVSSSLPVPIDMQPPSSYILFFISAELDS